MNVIASVRILRTRNGVIFRPDDEFDWDPQSIYVLERGSKEGYVEAIGRTVYTMLYEGEPTSRSESGVHPKGEGNSGTD